MKTTTARLLYMLVSLTVGAACSPKQVLPPPHPVHPPFDAEGTNAILVGPAAKDLTIPNVHLWQDATHSDVVVWVAINPKSTLYIDFHKEIFEGMTQPSPGLYRVQCVGARCDSGQLKSGVEHNTPFKYDQTLIDPSGKAEHADGMIIIKP